MQSLVEAVPSAGIYRTYYKFTTLQEWWIAFWDKHQKYISNQEVQDAAGLYMGMTGWQKLKLEKSSYEHRMILQSNDVIVANLVLEKIMQIRIKTQLKTNNPIYSSTWTRLVKIEDSDGRRTSAQQLQMPLRPIKALSGRL
jgi:hypothetical protein